MDYFNKGRYGDSIGFIVRFHPSLSLKHQLVNPTLGKVSKFPYKTPADLHTVGRQ